jgi:hypothetical protein
VRNSCQRTVAGFMNGELARLLWQMSALEMRCRCGYILRCKLCANNAIVKMEMWTWTRGGRICRIDDTRGLEVFGRSGIDLDRGSVRARWP